MRQVAIGEWRGDGDERADRWAERACAGLHRALATLFVEAARARVELRLLLQRADRGRE